MAKMDIAKKKCVTPQFRLSFPALAKPKAFQDQEPKYSLVMLFDADDAEALKPLKRAAFNAATEKWGEDKTKWPKRLRWPFRDGNEKPETQGYEGKTFVSATSKASAQPGMVDQKLQAILDVEKQLYSGCWARAEVIAYAYDVAGNRGISFSLQNVQKLKDDTPFSGRKRAEDVFDSVEDGSDDEESYDTDGDSDDGESAGMGF